MDEHDKIVAILRQVDVVISLLPLPQVPDQIHIIEAIKVAGNIKVHENIVVLIEHLCFSSYKNEENDAVSFIYLLCI